MENDIFVIGDLHIGDGGSRDNFGYPGSERPQQLNMFLDYISKHEGELIILGDLFEFWQTNFSRVMIKNMPLIERLGQLKPIYVIGNHDIDLVGFIEHKLLQPNLFQNLSGPVVRKIGDKTFYFMHGHEVDPANSGETPGVGRVAAILGGIGEDLFGSPLLPNGQQVEVVLMKWVNYALGLWRLFLNWCKRKITKGKIPAPKSQLTPRQNPDREQEVLLCYKAHREENHYDAVIVGHTHKPGRIDNWYFNCGSWATSDNNFIRITPSGEVQIFDWKNGQPVANETVLTLPKVPKEATI